MENTIAEQIALLLMDQVLSDDKRLHKLFLVRNRVLTVQDVAFLLGRDPRTIDAWADQQKYGLRMNVGPEGHKTMLYSEFVTWYKEQYKKPAPKLI